ncbi:hypothetical protein TNCV_1830071 [Trichonephila clavipes]|nr:hypothetical protein TNCV_1830071 [Trichonephila clavipes]
MENIRAHPANSGFKPQVESYKGFQLGVSQALPPAQCGGWYLVESGIEPRLSGLESDALTTRLPTAAEEIVDLARQINSQVDSDGVQELEDYHNQELTMDELIEMHEQDIEELESLDPVQSEDRMTFHAKIVEVEIGGVAIYRPFGEFSRANSYCHLYGAQGQRQAYFLPLNTMNFVGLVLTTSDSDEADFWLNGYVNKQNCRIWSEANPQVYVETPLHPEKLTVWCALWAGGILLQKR